MAYRPITREEIPQLAEVASRSFRFDASRLVESVQADEYRYSWKDGRVYEDPARGIVASMWLFENGVTVEGNEVRAGLVGMVSVPPEERRRGYANRMLREGLEEMREREIAISLLFPYSIPFYRRLGYGVASHIWALELPLDDMEHFDEFRQVRRMTNADMEAMQRLYERERRHHNGWMTRFPWTWRERVLDIEQRSEWPAKIEGVVVPTSGGEISGYLTYTLTKVDDIPGGHSPRAVAIQEWVSENDAAWRALAGFVVAQRGQAQLVTYIAPVGFPLHLTMAERNRYRIRHPMEFAFRDTLTVGAGLMGRIVHLEKALSTRGYPPEVRGECTLLVHDSLLPGNEAPVTLRVEAGSAVVEPGASSGNAAVADVSTWSEIYTGTLSARDARTVGHLEAEDNAVAFLDSLFRGDPWYIHKADWF